MMNVNATTMRLTAETFRTLYLEHGPRAQGFFLRMTGFDRELARDLTQDLFLRLWASRESYDSGRPFRTWMFSIAYNMLKNEYRRRMTIMEYVENAPKEEPVTDTDHLEQEQSDRILRSAICRLPEPQKVVFLLRYEEELPLSEIARVCNIPEGTVKSRLFTALTAVRNYCKINE
jgi:RNA polymerase sigma-70 factor (ECF subfamily)